MNSWFLVKINWPQIPNQYIGLGGNIWPELDGSDYNLYKKIRDSRSYITFSDSIIFVITDYLIAKEYGLILRDKNFDSIFISVHDIKVENATGYDFGNPIGGYSIIETEILLKKRHDLIERFLNKNLLFKNIALMREFIGSLKNADDIEDLFNYKEVAIKQILI
jgi:hypothetical protein